MGLDDRHLAYPYLWSHHPSGRQPAVFKLQFTSYEAQHKLHDMLISLKINLQGFWTIALGATTFWVCLSTRTARLFHCLKNLIFVRYIQGRAQVCFNRPGHLEYRLIINAMFTIFAVEFVLGVLIFIIGLRGALLCLHIDRKDFIYYGKCATFTCASDNMSGCW